MWISSKSEKQKLRPKNVISRLETYGTCVYSIHIAYTANLNMETYLKRTHTQTTVHILISVTALCYCTSTSDEKRLLDNLIRDYDVNLRPVANHSSALVINTEFTVVSLSSLNSVDETIDLKTYFYLVHLDRPRPHLGPDLSLRKIAAAIFWQFL